MKLTPTEIRSVLQALSNDELNAIVVGGQAVNLWASYYYRNVPMLEQYQPFASEDLDFYGGKVEAAICHQILGGKIVLNDNFDPSPNAGIVVVDYQDRKLRIDFLASVYGLSESEIEDTAISFIGTDELEGVELKVLNPILCLEGKLSNLNNLPQIGRQDKKTL